MFIAIAGEDAKFCSQLEKLLLSQNQYRVVVVSPLESLQKTLQVPPLAHLLVLAPRDDATTLVKSIRGDSSLSRLSILCVHPQGNVSTGVACLDAGADDFISRPFNAQIFLARVRTLLRRRILSGGLDEDEITVLRRGPLTMNLISRQTSLAGIPLVLTRLEFDLLAFLARVAGQAVQRQDILKSVWNYPDEVVTRTLDKHVETLRRKLGDFGPCLQTVHGVGYRLDPSSPTNISA